MAEHPGEVSVFVSKTIKELLFDGYYDGLIQDLSKLKGEDVLPNNTFGLYYGVSFKLSKSYLNI